MSWLSDLWNSIFKKKQSEPSPVKPPPVVTPPIDPIPWHTWFKVRIGWTEFDHDKELSKGWKYTNVPHYTTVIGAHNAWCMMSMNTALEENGYKGTHDAGADSIDLYPGQHISWLGFGIKKGSLVGIRHKDGSRHVTVANRDHTPGERALEGLGGNQNSSICVENFNVSGNASGHDEIVTVAWPVRA